MQVTEMQVHVRQRPPDSDPKRDALQALPGSGSVEVVITGEDGSRGLGAVSFGRIAGAPQALASLITHELRPLVTGTDVAQVRETHVAMLRETEYHGSGGLASFGIAAVDTALWDCLGKSRGVPCWKLWGAVHDRIPAYAMVGWLNYADDQVQAICAKAVEQGFGAVKIKVGYPTLREDLARIALVRQAIGDDVRLMVDANQSLSTSEAIRRGRAFQDVGITWWEEPLPADDIDGYTELAGALDIPVATGENLYSPHDFARFLRRNAVDIVQPDLRRAGGPTALLEIGALANAFRRPYASHGSDAAHLNVMACVPTVIYAETGLVQPGSPMRLRDGCIPLPQGAGLSWE